MTTVAADATLGVMCADSQWTDGDERGPVRKVFRVRRGLVGLAGDLDDVRQWLDLYRRRQIPEAGAPRSAPNVSVLRLTLERGLETWANSEGWIPVPDRWAIGSGGKCARAAMAAGATPQRAVRIAIDIDAGTNGAVRTYRLRE